MTVSGIYVIKNKSNGHFYLGSSQESDKRFRSHTNMLRNSKHDNIHLQRAWNKDGEESFEFEVIVECDKDDLIWIEQVYLDRYWPDGVLYNINPTADKLEFTPEIRRRMSRTARTKPPVTDETRRRLSSAGKGKKRSAKTRARMSRAKMGVKGTPWSAEARQKAIATRIEQGIFKGSKNPGSKLSELDVYEIRRLYATGFFSCAQIGRMWRVTPSNIGYIIQRKTWSHI